MKIYTKTGDDGTTGLLGNVRTRKDSLRIEAYGTVDELNAMIGVILAHLPETTDAAKPWLESIQSDLFIIGTLLAAPASDKPRAVLPGHRTETIEQQIDQMEEVLTPLTNFILPQGTPAASFAHLARTLSRRAERRVVALAGQERVDRGILAHLNRISDFLFVLACWVNMHEDGQETTWTYENEGPKTSKAASSAKDRMDTSLKKLHDAQEKRKTLFEKASTDLAKKKEAAQRLFHKQVDQINKDGGKVEKPFRDLDLD